MHRGEATHGWQARHPGPKALASALLLLSALALPQPGGLFVAAVSVTALIVLARVPLADIAHAMRAPLLFVAFSAAISAPQLSVGTGRIGISSYAVADSIALLTRSVGAVSALLVLTLTTSAADCLRLLTRLRVPPALAEVGLGLLRLVGLVGIERDRLMRAASMRGAHASRAARWRTAVAVAVALFGRTYRRGARLEKALALRSPGGLLATTPAYGPWRLRDACLGLALAAVPTMLWGLFV